MKFADCIYIVKCDLVSRKQTLSIASLLKDPISRFHFYLRLTEYFARKNAVNKSVAPFYYLLKWRFHSLSARLGFSIPENTLGKGVYLPHYGTIVINSRAYVGDYSVINVGVVLGRHPSSKDAVPTLGEGVFVGPGAKIFGNTQVGARSVIGANSVVSRDVDKQQLWAGAPAMFKRSISLEEYKKLVEISEVWHGWEEMIT